MTRVKSTSENLKAPNSHASGFDSALNRGALLIEYTGHGGIQTWADESIFRLEGCRRVTKSVPAVRHNNDLPQWAV